MTREQAKELLPIIIAWANGSQIQKLSKYTGGRWEDVEQLNAEWSECEYRFKPKLREWDIVIRRDGNISLHRSVPPGFVMSGDELIHVVEDMKERVK